MKPVNGFIGRRTELGPENVPFDNRDLARLVTHRSQLPGTDDSTPLLAVARSGSSANGILGLTPDDSSPFGRDTPRAVPRQ